MSFLVKDALENEMKEKAMPIWLAMYLTGKIIQIDVPPFEEFLEIKEEKPLRSAQEIESEFLEIVKKARETHG